MSGDVNYDPKDRSAMCSPFRPQVDQRRLEVHRLRQQFATAAGPLPHLQPQVSGEHARQGLLPLRPSAVPAL